MARIFPWLHETSECINEFAIVYMVNPILYVHKSSKEIVEKCMNNMFGSLTQPFIKKNLTINNTSGLALIMFHETRKKGQINISEC